MGRDRCAPAHGAQGGSVSVASLVTVMGLSGMTAAILSMTISSKNERLAAVDQSKALLVAEAGIAHALAELTAAANDDTKRASIVESLAHAVQDVGFSDGDYVVDVIDEGDGSYTVTSTARVRAATAAVEAVLQSEANGVFDNAIFAGNSSGDPTYSLELAGWGGQRDEIFGGLYSGGDIDVVADAEHDGTARALGEITGTDGVEAAGQSLPDLFAMNYEATADVDVYQEFLKSYTYTSDPFGGSAYQAPESSPAHIFRINPSDRQTEYQGTSKLDYFLEDPYETPRTDSKQDGIHASRISLSGLNGEPGSSGNGLVYFIDGNLWLHNKQTYSFKLNSAAGGVQVTFVVKGNIYFSDNFFYEDQDNDGVAFIAMKDDRVADSGNIYFGDPVFGTIARMESFMYAENNLYDLNLDSSGSAEVEVYGTMSAGNQVVIERDYTTSKGTAHTKLTVDFDERVRDGVITLPGSPGSSGEEGDGVRFDVVSWRQVPVQ